MLSRIVVLMSVLLGAVGIADGGGPPQTPPATAEPQAFREFTERVQAYLNLRKKLPRERTTRRTEEIADRRLALAQAIRELRAGAKQGDIFTAAVSEEFLRVIRDTLQKSAVRRTIRQEEPVANLHLTVNGAYPEHLPLTTVPPTLLVRLPQLPERMAYRIVGHDFVLQDTEARLVIDFIPGALP
jgi:hypothetical protein